MEKKALRTCFMFLKFSLISFNLIGWERNSAEAVQDWQNVLSCQFIFCKSKELK